MTKTEENERQEEEDRVFVLFSLFAFSCQSC